MFAKRLGWDVIVRDGREIDEYDRFDPAYIVGLFGATGASIGDGEARAAVSMIDPRGIVLWTGEGTGG